jgi:nucleoid-associated protein YgaU
MKLVSIVLSLLVIANFAAFAQDSYNYEEMKMEEYNALLAEWQGRLDAAQQGIAAEDEKIAAAQKCVGDQQVLIDSVWNDIYLALGTTKEEAEQYRKDAEQLRADANSMLSLSPEEIYSRKAELRALKDRLAELRKHNLALLTENEKLLNQIESLIMQAEEKGKPAVPDMYTVVRGDFLWNIAKKSEIYNDPYAWSRIYTTNRDQIKNPDLIYPKQIFRIPRDVGPNEHLVARGEYLSKISGYANVYSSPFKWQRLYEANKEVVADPNLIFPYQVLQIPRN